MIVEKIKNPLTLTTLVVVTVGIIRNFGHVKDGNSVIVANAFNFKMQCFKQWRLDNRK